LKSGIVFLSIDQIKPKWPRFLTKQKEKKKISDQTATFRLYRVPSIKRVIWPNVNKPKINTYTFRDKRARKKVDEKIHANFLTCHKFQNANSAVAFRPAKKNRRSSIALSGTYFLNQINFDFAKTAHARSKVCSSDDCAELSNSKNFFQKVDGLERERKIIFFSALRTNVFVNFATDHTHSPQNLFRGPSD
jgi:hypothetical protein